MKRRRITYQAAVSGALKQGLQKQKQWNESNDCSVRALATITGLPYERIHYELALCGRKNRMPTSQNHQWRVLRKLGYDLEFRDPEADLGIRTYISLHKARPAGNWLVYTHRHVAAYTRKTLHDYAHFLNTRRRVVVMVKVIKRRK